MGGGWSSAARSAAKIHGILLFSGGGRCPLGKLNFGAPHWILGVVWVVLQKKVCNHNYTTPAWVGRGFQQDSVRSDSQIFSYSRYQNASIGRKSHTAAVDFREPAASQPAASRPASQPVSASQPAAGSQQPASQPPAASRQPPALSAKIKNRENQISAKYKSFYFKS